MFKHIDLTGLKTTPMRGAPLIASQDGAIAALNLGNPLVAAGMRHSQGGHTAVENGYMLVMETMKKVGGPYEDKRAPGGHSIEVEAGATWSDVHRVVCSYGLAPIVQQSSAHFTIGGSISVNCHGRDVRWGTVAETVSWMEILLPNGKVVETTPGEKLFRAAIGGYGACGLILRARIMLDRNWVMGREIHQTSSSNGYAKILKQIDTNKFKLKDGTDGSGKPAPKTLHMHHGWVNVFEKENYLKEVLPHYSFVDRGSSVTGSPEHTNGRTLPPSELKTEGWGTSEIMRAAWEAAKIDPAFAKEIWDELKKPPETPVTQNNTRLDYLREDILFTSSMTNGSRADLLQESFVPIDQFESFMASLAREIPFRGGDVHLLSCTTRLVRKPNQPGQAPFLSYCRDDKSVVSIAIEASVQVEGETATGYLPTPSASTKFKKAIDSAIAHGGTYYLPYHQFADSYQLKRCYPALQSFLAEADEYNLNKLFDNDFLKGIR